MAAEELPRPGVSVIQQFRTVSPTIVQPTLVPCVVGVCRQVVEALETDSTGNTTINDDAIAEVPPIVTSTSSGLYMGLDGLVLGVSVNGGPDQEVTFSDPTSAGLTAAQVKSQILATSGLSGWTTYVVIHTSSHYVQLQGINSGDGQTLKVLVGSANSVLGFDDNFTAYGFSSYTQDELFVAQINFPDPRDNIDELDVDESTIRVFMVPSDGSSSVAEAKDDETFLRLGHTAWLKSSTISFPTASMKAKTLLLTLLKGGSQQTVTFSGDLWEMAGTLVVPGSAYSAPVTDTIEIQKNGETPVLVTFSTPATIDAAVTQINAAWDAVYTGEDVCYRSLVNGVADPAGTYIAFQVGGAAATGDVVKVIEPVAGDAYVDVGFVVGSGSVSSSLVFEINDALNATIAQPHAADGGVDLLKLISYDGYILIDKDGTGNSTLGLATASDTEQYAIVGVDDGDGDTKSPLVRIHNEDFGLDAASASLTGTADLTAINRAHKLTFRISIDGKPLQEIEFNGGPTIASNTSYVDPGTDALGMIVNGTPVLVTFANPLDIDAAINAINTAAGQPVCYRSTVLGVADVGGAYISFQVGGAADAGGEIVMDYSTSTGNAWTDIGFTVVVNIYQTLTAAEIATAVEDTMGVGTAAIVSYKLVLSSAIYGDESKVKIHLGTANTLLGFASNQVNRGRAFKPIAGDDLYAEGVRIGQIVQVNPGAVVTDVRLDVKLKFAGWEKKSWYIQALSIPSSLPSTRPTPDLVVDLAGDITIKADILRDNRGEPVHEAGASGSAVADTLLITYQALRLDVTGRANTPALLTFEDTEELEDALDPIDPDNPLGLGIYFALLNAPGVTVTGLGVDGYSSSLPYGTLAAHTRAANFLESEEVYALAPLTHEAVIHQMWKTHVDYMSQPDARGERILLACPGMPERELDTLVASGTDGDTTGVTNKFDTKISNLATLLNAQGIDPLSITAEDGVFLDIATNALNYNLASVSGTTVTINVTFAPGENDDGFYSTTNLATPLISESFSIKIRGAELVDSNGDPNYSEIANTLSSLGQSYADRRMYLIVPDLCGAMIDSLEQQLPSFYMAAAIAGMTGQQRPQQGFTNFPITGFTQVIGSNDSFSNTQMNVAAAGGVWWIVQDVAGGPLTTRHQLSTNISSIETREFSITKVVDFAAKLMRAGLRNFIGKFNITQGFLDTLSTTIQGQLSFLQENGVIIGGDLNNIVQDTDNPDTVLIDTTLDVPYPCNFVRLCLVV